MPPFSDSYAYFFMAQIATKLWGDPVGAIFLMTIASYFVGYALYGGYLSRFTGGFSGISFSRLGFQISDLITLLPTVIVTMISISWRALRYMVFWLSTFVGFEIFVVGVGIFVGELLRNNEIIPAMIITQLGLLCFIIGIFIALYFIYPIHKKLKWAMLAFFLQIVGIILMYSGQTNLSDPLILSEFFFDNDLVLLLVIIVRELTVLTIVICSLALPIVFGMQMGNIALQGKTLSKIISITTNFPIHQLDSWSNNNNNNTLSNRIHVPVEPWHAKAFVSLSMKPDVYVYRFDNKYTAYMVDIFTDRTGVYFLRDDDKSGAGFLLLVKQELIQAIELAETIDHE